MIAAATGELVLVFGELEAKFPVLSIRNPAGSGSGGGGGAASPAPVSSPAGITAADGFGRLMEAYHGAGTGAKRWRSLRSPLKEVVLQAVANQKMSISQSRNAYTLAPVRQFVSLLHCWACANWELHALEECPVRLQTASPESLRLPRQVTAEALELAYDLHKALSVRTVHPFMEIVPSAADDETESATTAAATPVAAPKPKPALTAAAAATAKRPLAPSAGVKAAAVQKAGSASAVAASSAAQTAAAAKQQKPKPKPATTTSTAQPTLSSKSKPAARGAGDASSSKPSSKPARKPAAANSSANAKGADGKDLGAAEINDPNPAFTSILKQLSELSATFKLLQKSGLPNIPPPPAVPSRPPAHASVPVSVPVSAPAPTPAPAPAPAPVASIAQLPFLPARPPPPSPSKSSQSITRSNSLEAMPSLLDLVTRTRPPPPPTPAPASVTTPTSAGSGAASGGVSMDVSEGNATPKSADPTAPPPTATDSAASAAAAADGGTAPKIPICGGVGCGVSLDRSQGAISHPIADSFPLTGLTLLVGSSDSEYKYELCSKCHKKLSDLVKGDQLPPNTPRVSHLQSPHPPIRQWALTQTALLRAKPEGPDWSQLIGAISSVSGEVERLRDTTDRDRSALLDIIETQTEHLNAFVMRWNKPSAVMRLLPVTASPVPPPPIIPMPADMITRPVSPSPWGERASAFAAAAATASSDVPSPDIVMSDSAASKSAQ